MAGRDELIERLRRDLIGPFEESEVLESRPSDVYLTGILYPKRTEIGPEQDERLEIGDEQAGAPEQGRSDASVSLSSTMRPSSAGVSFAVASNSGQPTLTFTVTCGTYEATEVADRRLEWQRVPHAIQIDRVDVPAKDVEIPLVDFGLPGLSLYLRSTPWKESRLVTAALVNRLQPEEKGRRAWEEASFYQVELQVQPGPETRLLARPTTRVSIDDDDRSSELLYRNAREYAVGHTCSAGWTASGDSADEVHTTWIPVTHVPSTKASGSPELEALLTDDPETGTLSATALFRASGEPLTELLASLPEAYGEWIADQRSRIPDLPKKLTVRAEEHLDRCERAGVRMQAGIDLIGSNRVAEKAFRLANRAMVMQRQWAHPQGSLLVWRPFQLAFVLLVLPSLTEREHPDRETMDLLWFPTGGGKTEAYLCLIAYLLFLRRLRAGETGDPDDGAGVAAFMRYTLRLLTMQQYQRAAALVLACEVMRRGHDRPAGIDEGFGKIPFSLGLWVGGDATPNTRHEAVKALVNCQPNSPAQVRDCPACGERLSWQPTSDEEHVLAWCRNKDCILRDAEVPLPIWTIDDDVYERTPSLVIATIDKFAQIVRKRESRRIFGNGTPHDPPDLILQDELHLISGPLGTLAGLYEVAVDQLCIRDGQPAKVIGSTATIRRASEQISALFDREGVLFPPPGLDADNSGFSVRDESVPGREYAGVTTTGRSAKFTLQAVSASLLQSAHAAELSADEHNYYWTLVAYFNSLRELGGALVLMHDDVGATIRLIARRRGESERGTRIIEELTSRRTQMEIRDQLKELERKPPDPAAIDALLATNMISVGVDIPRLGLMVVNGQPKGIAEYIQATSRVGRGDVPGLIVGVFNDAKARDRSHYETFRTWHQTLYREVETTSVTPFASRARDKALHAPLVAFVRHTVGNMGESPSLTDEGKEALKIISDAVVERCREVDPSETEAVANELAELTRSWERRPGLKAYWNDYQIDTSLLMSAEKAARLEATDRPKGLAWATPNSMRNVDPGTRFVLAPALRQTETPSDG